MAMDYILNNQGYGSVATRLLNTNGEIGSLRPWTHPKTGQSYITLSNGTDPKTGKPRVRHILTNASAPLTGQEWVHFDRVVKDVALPKLNVWGDLEAAGLTYNVPNAMSKTVIQHQVGNDYGEAQLSIDGIAKTRMDRPQSDLVNIPLPIVHSDFNFTMRDILISRNGNNPLDIGPVRKAVRRCTELIEKLTLGTLSSYSFGGGTIYGLTNMPTRITKTLTSPTTSGWTPQVLNDEILDMIQSAQNIFFNGPYGLYFSYPWTKYLDGDYSATYNGSTLRTRLKLIDELKFIKKTDYLTGYQAILVQLDPDMIQAVNGIRLTTVQWEEHGGWEWVFKVFGIMVPRLMNNGNGEIGLVHGSAA